MNFQTASTIDSQVSTKDGQINVTSTITASIRVTTSNTINIGIINVKKTPRRQDAGEEHTKMKPKHTAESQKNEYPKLRSKRRSRPNKQKHQSRYFQQRMHI